MKFKTYPTYISIAALIFLQSCQKDTDLVIAPDAVLLQSQLVQLYGSTDKLKLPQGDSYSNIPSDPKNPLTIEKIELGKLLFHETSLALNPKLESGKNTYSCASCHQSKAGFQSGLKQGIGEGGKGFGNFGEGRIMSSKYDVTEIDVQPIRSPTILNSAYQKLMLWNGQFGATGPNEGTESQWTEGTPKATNTLGFEGVETQAIAGIDVHRLKIDSTFIADSQYRALFDAAFGHIPQEKRYSRLNAGLAIAAYERSVLPNQAPFQKWLNGDMDAMTEKETLGAGLFFGKANCYSCHSGPALNDMKFHVLGMADLKGAGVHGDVDEMTQKGRGGFTGNTDDDYAFKTPTIYNLKDVGFLGHGGSFTSVRQIIEYKNMAQAENSNVPEEKLSPLFKPLNLTNTEIDQLTSFVWNALHDDNLERYVPESLPSGNCFPNADEASRGDMGCN